MSCIEGYERPVWGHHFEGSTTSVIEEGLHGRLYKRSWGRTVEVKVSVEGHIFRTEDGLERSLQKSTVKLGDNQYEILITSREHKPMKYFLRDHREFHKWLDALRAATTAQFSFFYRLGPMIGSGQYGKVFDCTSKQSSKRYAVKIVSRNSISAEMKKKLANELEVVKMCESPYLVKTYETFQSPSNIYFVMEKIHSGDCLDFLSDKKEFSEEEARSVMFQVISGISVLHSAGVVHRDVKLENVLVCCKDRLEVKLADFGLSRIIADAEVNTEGSESRALSTQVGTYPYMAPEILREKSYGEAVDLWSSGIVMHLLLFSRFPFESETEICRVRRMMHGEKEHWCKVSDDGRDFLCNLLHVNPKKRLTAQQALQHRWFWGLRTQSKSHTLLGRLKSLDFGTFPSLNSSASFDVLDSDSLHSINRTPKKSNFSRGPSIKLVGQRRHAKANAP